jgi:hypothetical protein
MTSFVNAPQLTEHAGVTRFESALVSANQLRRDVSGSRSLATLLLSAMASAVMVAAYEVMDTVAEGHLLVIWTGLWVAAFAALALSAGTARRLATRARLALDAWSLSIARSRADERLWAIAKTDGRVMAELQVAMQRDDSLMSGRSAPRGKKLRMGAHDRAEP